MAAIMLDKFPVKSFDGLMWSLTPYGVSFAKLPEGPWRFYYDNVISYGQQYGHISDEMLAIRLAQLTDNCELVQKPRIIYILEKITGIVAKRRPFVFGSWCVRSEKFCINYDPFESKIELFLADDEVKQISFDELLKILQKYEFAINNCVACGGGSKFFCSKCRFTRYCSRECQLAHWPQHKNECALLFDNKKNYS